MSKLKKFDQKSILIVGERSQARDSLASRLRLSGPNVEVSTSGFQAMAMLDDPDNCFDFCLLHGQVQDLNKQELLLNINSLDKDPRPVTLIIPSANESRDDLSQLDADIIFESNISFSELVKNLQSL